MRIQPSAVDRLMRAQSAQAVNQLKELLEKILREAVETPYHPSACGRLWGWERLGPWRRRTLASRRVLKSSERPLGTALLAVDGQARLPDQCLAQPACQGPLKQTTRRSAATESGSRQRDLGETPCDAAC